MKNNSLEIIKQKAKKFGESSREAEIRRLTAALNKLRDEDGVEVREILTDIMNWAGANNRISLEGCLEDLLIAEFNFYGDDDEEEDDWDSDRW